MLVGARANLFWKQHERTHMTAKPAFERLGKALGSKTFLMSMDGQPHAQLRSLYQEVMSGKAAEGYAAIFADHAGRYLERWSQDGDADASKHFKRLVYRQLADALTPLSAEEQFEDVVRVFDTGVKIGVSRVWPAFMGYTPWVIASKRRLRLLRDRLIEAAQADPNGHTFIHAVLRGRQQGLLEDDDLLVSILSPYFAGIDTITSTLASAVYVLISQPNVLAVLREELDALGPDALRNHRVLRKQVHLRAFLQEVMRLYSVTILTFRQATRDIEFEGYHIAAGTMLGFCPALPHFLPEHFADPHKFRLDRWLGARPCAAHEHVPFGVGAHVCIGAGLAEVQLLTTLAVLIDGFDPTLADPNYTFAQVLDPLPTPKNLRVRFATRQD